MYRLALKRRPITSGRRAAVERDINFPPTVPEVYALARVFYTTNVYIFFIRPRGKFTSHRYLGHTPFPGKHPVPDLSPRDSHSRIEPDVLQLTFRNSS